MNSQQQTEQLRLAIKHSIILEKKLAELNKEINFKMQKLHETMEEENCDGIAINGNMFKPHIKRSFILIDAPPGVKFDDDPRWFKWLKEIGEGGLIKTKETVPWNTREKFLGERVDEGLSVPDFTEEKYYFTIKYNKSALKKEVEEEIEQGVHNEV